MKNVVCLIGFLFLVSCKSIHGVYSNREERLILHPDSTFEYTYAVGWHKKYAEGRWSPIDKNRYLIESNISPQRITVLQTKTESSNCRLRLNPITSNDTTVLKYLIYELVKDTAVVLSVRPFEVVDIPVPLRNSQIRVRVSTPGEEIRPFIVNKYLYTEKFAADCSSSNQAFTVTFPVKVDYFYLTAIEGDTISIHGNKLKWKQTILRGSKLNTDSE